MDNDSANRTMTARLQAPVFLLGLGGLIPFAGLALGAFRMPHPHELWFFTALTGYGAVILSFVGALQWGMLLRDETASRGEIWLSLGWGVTPALIGWAALLLPADAGLRVMAAAFILCLMMDMRFAMRHAVPAWYLKLRFVLTAGAVVCLLAASFAPTDFGMMPIGTRV